MSRDTCDELSTPATAIRRCAISVGVSDDTRRPTIYNASVPLSQQIGSHWTGTTGDGSTRRRPGTCVHSACPSPPAPSTQQPIDLHRPAAGTSSSLPEAKHRCAALEGDLCIFLTIGVSIKTRCEGGGDSFVYLSRRLSSIVSAGALAPGHSSKLYMRKR